MSTSLKVGARLRSSGHGTEVIVVRAPVEPVVLSCAGGSMEAVDDAPAGPGGTATTGSLIQIGKRYYDEQSGTELLCTKPGPGPITIDGRVLEPRSAKPLPSSD